MSARSPGLAVAATLALAAAGCAPALRPPPTSAAEISRSAPAPAPAAPETRSALETARAGWALRPDPASVRAAERAFLEAAEQDPSGIEALIGAARAKAWLAEHESDPGVRETLATSLVQTAQLCAERAPGNAACDYWLGIALGVQARERPTTADASIKEMIAALRRADAADPSFDRAGPARVLALVYLRAPGWPIGPGDPETGLAEARRAIAAVPGYAPNLLALAEGLEKTGDTAQARATYERAREAAAAAAASGEPDAADWMRDAERALSR